MELIPLYLCKLKPLDVSDHSMLYQALMNEAVATPEQENDLHVKLLQCPDEYRILFDLLNEADVVCSAHLLLFLVSYCKDSRELPMWAFTLYCIKHIDGYRKVSLMPLTMYQFVTGFPERSDLLRIWRAQKKTLSSGKRINAVKQVRYWERAVQKLKSKRNSK